MLLVMKQFLTEKNVLFIIQTLNFWLFHTLKMGLKGTRFATLEDIKSSAMPKLWKIPKEALHWCFQQRQDQWNKCVYPVNNDDLSHGLRCPGHETNHSTLANV
jgi:hypothetical protein